MAIAACVARDQSTSDESHALVELRQQLHARKDDVDGLVIRTTTTGLALPAWVPNRIKDAVGPGLFHVEAYVAVPTLVHDASQLPRDLDNLRGLTEAISRMPASSSGLDDAKTAAELASPQHFRIDSDN